MWQSLTSPWFHHLSFPTNDVARTSADCVSNWGREGRHHWKKENERKERGKGSESSSPFLFSLFWRQIYADCLSKIKRKEGDYSAFFVVPHIFAGIASTWYKLPLILIFFSSEQAILLFLLLKKMQAHAPLSHKKAKAELYSSFYFSRVYIRESPISRSFISWKKKNIGRGYRVPSIVAGNKQGEERGKLMHFVSELEKEEKLYWWKGKGVEESKWAG